jgi:serine phosphatase RsbU (regulator of sigma subunit)
MSWFHAYTHDLRPDDLQRLFTRDTKEAYRYFARQLDLRALQVLPWYQQFFTHAQMIFTAFAMKLSPARRILYGVALLLAAVGVVQLLGVGLPKGAGVLVVAFVLMNLLVLLEVADRLSLKNDLEVARQIQQIMLGSGTFAGPGVETVGLSRPANTVGGDFFEIHPLADGRVVVAVGDVAGKGSPAALLMALLLAMMRTLTDERFDPAELVTRLNAQVCRQAPGSRFITLFFGVYDARTGELSYVNAGHVPPLVLRAADTTERLLDGGTALGLFEGSTYVAGRVLLQPQDLVAVYTDGITEAEDPGGRPFDEQGLEAALRTHRRQDLAAIGAGVVSAVEVHTSDTRLADDLTILLLRRAATVAAPAGV